MRVRSPPRCTPASRRCGRHCPANFRRPVRKIALTEAVEADVARIEAAWAHARKTFGKAGPFLFGRFSAADAMYAPVVNRLHIYDVPVSRADARLYVGGDGAAGVEGLDRRRRGGRMAHRKIRRDLTSRAALADARARRGPRARVRTIGGGTHHRRGARARPLEGFLPQRDDGELAGLLRRARRRLRRAQLCLRQFLSRSATTRSPTRSPGSLYDLFFFSVETSSTVGYGDMHPQTFYGHVGRDRRRASSPWC